METSEGGLLGGRVRYAQPCQGFRTGIEPVFLAAAVPARPGQNILEGGCGAGAGLLCLATRVPGISGLGVELDPSLVAIARRNAAANQRAQLHFTAADMANAGVIGQFEHAFANPPYHRPCGTTSPDRGREQAKRSRPGLLRDWTRIISAALVYRGTLTLCLPPGMVPGAMAAFAAAGCAPVALFPLWPRTGQAARLLLLQGVKGGRGSLRLLSGMTLHRPDGGFTLEAEAILRAGAPLSMA